MKKTVVLGAAVFGSMVLFLIGCGDASLENPAASQAGFGLNASDAKALNTTIKTMPPAETSSTSATFTFICNQKPCTFQCKLDAATKWAKCKSPKNYTGLAEGNHAFLVRAINSAGKIDKSPASYNWAVRLYPGNWTATSTTNAPSARTRAKAVWTGTEMIVFGGEISFGTYSDSPEKYNPATDTWSVGSSVNSPGGRKDHALSWDSADSRMITFGGYSLGRLNNGGLYDPAGDSWSAMSLTNAPGYRDHPAGVWTGNKMIVWGGEAADYLNTGGVYDPVGDSWTETSTANAPEGRTPTATAWWPSAWGATTPNLRRHESAT